MSTLITCNYFPLGVNKFIQFVAGPYSDIFAGALGADAGHQPKNIRHVLRMQRNAPGEGDFLALNRRVVEISDNVRFHLLGEEFAGIQPPGAFVIAVGALVDAAGNEEGAAGVGSIYYVDRIVLVISHLSSAHLAL